MGAKDLAEKNLLQYKKMYFSDIVNVNLFGGRCYVSAEELSRTRRVDYESRIRMINFGSYRWILPMKCKHNRSFFLCLENQSDKNNVMPVRDMGYPACQIWSR